MCLVLTHRSIENFSVSGFHTHTRARTHTIVIHVYFNPHEGGNQRVWPCVCWWYPLRQCTCSVWSGVPWRRRSSKPRKVHCGIWCPRWSPQDMTDLGSKVPPPTTSWLHRLLSIVGTQADWARISDCNQHWSENKHILIESTSNILLMT